VHIGLRPRFDISPAEAKLGMNQWIGVEQSCIEQAYSLIVNRNVPDNSKGRILTEMSANGISIAQQRSTSP
jgi:hypothetical protein